MDSAKISIGFGISDAMTALSLIIVIQQFLKPIYELRLKTKNLSKERIYKLIFLGFVFACLAKLLPLIPSLGTFAMPIIYEIISVALFAGTLISAVFISLSPVKVNKKSLLRFVKSSAQLLAKSSSSDYVDFTQDLVKSLPELILYAKQFHDIERKSVMLEFERLKEQGLPLTIQGRLDIDAFLEFSKRDILKRARAAGTLLIILSDPKFCEILVCKCAWIVASMLMEISNRKLHAEQANAFVQELVRQALSNDNSILGREMHYSGFAAVPVLSQNMFANAFVLASYNPLQKLSLEMPEVVSNEFIFRFNKAAEQILQTRLEEKEHTLDDSFSPAVIIYERICWNLKLDNSNDMKKYSTLTSGINNLCKIAMESFASTRQIDKHRFYTKDSKEIRNDFIHSIALIVFTYLETVANDFDGYKSKSWLGVIQLFLQLYPSHSTNEPKGVNPLQQQVAIILLERLSFNMKGWYPPISRVLIAVLGHCPIEIETEDPTAYVILKKAVYYQLKQLPKLYSMSPNKIVDFLPSSVIYDPDTTILEHTDAIGCKKITNLSRIAISEIKLTNEKNWQI